MFPSQMQGNQKRMEWKFKLKRNVRAIEDVDAAYINHSKAEQQRQTLEAQLSTLPLNDAAKATVLQMQEVLQAQRESLASLLESIPLSARKPPNAATLVQQVLNIPELLEHILLYVDNSDLLDSYCVSRQFYNAIEASPSLQRRLGLQATPNSSIHFPAEYLGSWMYSTDAEGPRSTRGTAKGSKILVSIYPGSLLVRLGTRCRSMLICQPPVRQVKLFTSCCSKNRSNFLAQFAPGGGPTSPAPLANVCAQGDSAGVTVGDINDAMELALAKHRLCPDATIYDHNDDGSVNVRFELEFEIDVIDAEPLWQAKVARIRADKDESIKKKETQRRLEWYMQAKSAARDDGRPIPTLAEFEATLDVGTV
ncbi:hypothetical protein LTR37_018855 [Vermiconidia calcicola]|uniref:Uncharacterized protein n=1 Tax=Vermiconidia calcicola TaxID=1690605 RepID=A0ACC3MHM9_9PEZI|nr:hypothetical protein LTR37_018855 [Vermiconidia calcicola]